MENSEKTRTMLNLLSSDTEHKAYMESILANMELIVDNHDMGHKSITPKEGLEMLRDNAKLTKMCINYIHEICEHRYTLIKENAQLKSKMRNMEEMVFGEKEQN